MILRSGMLHHLVVAPPPLKPSPGVGEALVAPPAAAVSVTVAAVVAAGC